MKLTKPASSLCLSLALLLTPFVVWAICNDVAWTGNCPDPGPTPTVPTEPCGSYYSFDTVSTWTAHGETGPLRDCHANIIIIPVTEYVMGPLAGLPPEYDCDYQGQSAGSVSCTSATCEDWCGG